MCGIAGVVRGKDYRCPSSIVPDLWKLLENRGPDDLGYMSFGPHAPFLSRKWRPEDANCETIFVQRRLSIIDLDEGGWQPMGTLDGRYYITFNGEIYNYLELRRELEGLGVRFRSQSDTEVLLYAFAEWGTACLCKLIGMFAFAVLDTQSRKVTLVRDFFGIKPLFYAAPGGSLVFASTLPAVLAAPGISRQLDRKRLYDFLRFGFSNREGRTLLSEVNELPPSHFLEVFLDNPSEIKLQKYWEPKLDPDIHQLSFADASKNLRDLFLRSVELHLRSDVPVGCALSGGIDSTAVAMCMREVGGQALDLHAFSFVSEDPSLSEEHWINLAGKACGATVHKIVPHAEDLRADFIALVESQGEPFASTNIYAQRAIMRLAKENGIKVVLEGQGADELLAGYDYYRGARLASLLRQHRWREALDFVRQVQSYLGSGWWDSLQRCGEYIVPQSFHAVLRRLIGRELLPAWLDASYFAREIGSVGTHNSRRSGSKEVLLEELNRTLLDTGVPRLLRYGDQNAMAYSIENRVPFLTPQLVNFVFSLPEEYIISQNGETKSVFRAAMRGLIPEKILGRRDKIGFAAPERLWLSSLSDWIDSRLNSEAAKRFAFIKPNILREHWSQVSSGKRQFTNYLWRCLNFIAWAEVHNVTSPDA